MSDVEHNRPGDGPSKRVMWILVIVMILISIGLATVDW